MSIVDRADVSRRRGRAGRIREGMKSFVADLSVVFDGLAEAYRSEHWRVLGYDSWETYVVGEFGSEGHDFARRALIAAKIPHGDTPVDARPVYFIQALAGGLIKIGVAGDVTARLADIQRMCPIPLTIVATIADLGQTGERALHQRFAAARRHGEWFEPTPDLLAYISANGVPA